jgi:hypothetical protein
MLKIKPWHLFALTGLLYACSRPRRSEEPSATDPGTIGGIDEPDLLTDDVYVFVHDTALISPTLLAAKRIEKASGIKINVNVNGSIATASPIFGSDFLCATGTEGRSADYGIAVARNCRIEPEQVILHELMHLLGIHGHLELPDKGVMNALKDGPLAKISAADLTALCSVRDCSEFNPEI